VTFTDDNDGLLYRLYCVYPRTSVYRPPFPFADDGLTSSRRHVVTQSASEASRACKNYVEESVESSKKVFWNDTNARRLACDANATDRNLMSGVCLSCPHPSIHPYDGTSTGNGIHTGAT
jgi:hypothetical protein